MHARLLTFCSVCLAESTLIHVHRTHAHTRTLTHVRVHTHTFSVSPLARARALSLSPCHLSLSLKLDANGTSGTSGAAWHGPRRTPRQCCGQSSFLSQCECLSRCHFSCCCLFFVLTLSPPSVPFTTPCATFCVFHVYLRLAFDSIYRVKCKPLWHDGNNDHMAGATKFLFVCTQTYDEIAKNIRSDVCFLLQSTRRRRLKLKISLTLSNKHILSLSLSLSPSLPPFPSRSLSCSLSRSRSRSRARALSLSVPDGQTGGGRMRSGNLYSVSPTPQSDSRLLLQPKSPVRQVAGQGVGEKEGRRGRRVWGI